jgi:hypothetical protein
VVGVCGGELRQRRLCGASARDVAKRIETKEVGDDSAGSLTLAQDAGRAVPGDVRSLPGRGKSAVGEHDVLAIAVFDVPVGVEHVPVGVALDGGVCRQFILSESRFEELLNGHGFFLETQNLPQDSVPGSSCSDRRGVFIARGITWGVSAIRASGRG